MAKQPKFTIKQFNETFPDDDACLEVLKDLIYPEGIICRQCDKVRPHHRLSNRKAYSCDYCGTHVYPLAGTIFEKSTTSLKSWFYAMFLISSTRCGISAKQLERELGVTYKTAWRMFNQIRKLMGEDLGTMGGLKSVEIDEAYIGGRKRRIKGQPSPESQKIAVLGIVERGGKVAALVTGNAKRATIMPIIKEKVLPRSMVYTDEYGAYTRLDQHYSHRRIPHNEKVYVMGDIHTNTIEGFWSLLKNGIRGVYHSVSSKHL
ncbi:MAG TPA: IS1595 family transposase [Dehalococcoidia bacterium]|nr:IS1595 family transposase [Dehalococcoidia bacterium]